MMHRLFPSASAIAVFLCASVAHASEPRIAYDTSSFGDGFDAPSPTAFDAAATPPETMAELGSSNDTRATQFAYSDESAGPTQPLDMPSFTDGYSRKLLLTNGIASLEGASGGGIASVRCV